MRLKITIAFKKSILFGLFLVISPFSTLLAQVYGTQTPQLFDGTSGTVKGYLENLPNDFKTNNTAKYPVLIFFHGSGEMGNGVPFQISQLLSHGPPQLIANGTWPSSFSVGGKTFKFLVISPQCSSYWQASDVQYVVNQVFSKYASRIDLSRIYLTGLSAGGGGIWDYLASNSNFGNQIAASVICCGSTSYGNQTRVNNIVASNLPIWAFQNELDPTVSPTNSTGWIENLNASKINPSAKLTLYPGIASHDCWDATYDPSYSNSNKIYEWLLSNQRGSAQLAPISNAGKVQCISLPSTVTLDGSSSIGTSGNIVSYQWTKLSGYSGDQIQSPNSAKTNINFTLAATYVYQLTVTDNQGLVNSSSVKIIVNPNGAALPIVKIPPINTIIFPNQAHINGSGSTATVGSIISYVWSKASGPVNDVIQNPGQASTSINFNSPGTYSYVLTIGDNYGNFSSGSVTVNVQNSGATGLIASAGSNQTILLPNSAILDGTGSTDGMGTLNSFIWSKVSGPTGDQIQNSQTAKTIVSFTQTGNYVYLITVKDNSGNTGSSSVTVIVNSSTLPPVANAGGFLNTTLPSGAILDASASKAPSGNLVSYLWAKLSGPSGDQIQNPNSITTPVSFTQAGSYVYQITVKDNNGNSNSATTQITVKTGLVPPLANAGSNQTITLPSLASLDGSGSSDTSGTIASYLWNKLSGPGGDTIQNPNTSITAVNFSQAGTYVYRLTVKDNNSLSNSNSITIIVNSLPVTGGLDKTFIHFGDNNHIAPSPWNNIGWQLNMGTLENLTDANGVSSGQISIPNPFSGAANIGVNTGNNSGIYPDLITQSGYDYAGSDTVSVKISNLNVHNLYNFSFFSSWANPWSGAKTNYLIGSTQVSLDATNNSSSVVSIIGVVPDASGAVIIKMVKQNGSAYALINAIEMDSYASGITGQGPLAPILNSAHGNSKTSIGLNWTQSPNTQKYYIYQSGNNSGPFTLIDSVPSTKSSLLVSGLNPNSGYYYQVVAGNSTGKSVASNIKYGLTLLNTLNISFNMDMPAGSPWNDLNAGQQLTNLVNADGTSSTIGFHIIRNFLGTAIVGAETYQNSGIYPDDVIRGQYYTANGDSAVVQLNGLNKSQSYDLVFFNSWGSPWSKGITNFRVGNQYVSLDPTNNTTNTVEINNLIPDNNGNLTYSVKAATGSMFGLINALVVQVHGQAPNTPNSTLSLDKFSLAHSFAPDTSQLKANTINIFPNPFVNQINMNINSVSNGQFKVTIFDIQGRKIYSESNQTLFPGLNQKTMNSGLSGLAKGIYLLKIQSDVFKDQVFRIQKQ